MKACGGCISCNFICFKGMYFNFLDAASVKFLKKADKKLSIPNRGF